MKMKLDERDSERKQRELRFAHATKQAEKPRCAKCKARLLHKHAEDDLCLDCQHQVSNEMAYVAEDLEPWTEIDDKRYAEFLAQELGIPDDQKVIL